MGTVMRWLLLLGLLLPSLARADSMGEAIIDQVLTLTLDTGNNTDCDSTPTVDIYEEDIDTPILNNQAMTTLDAANTNGLYDYKPTLSAANGYEVGKTYTALYTCVLSGSTKTTTDKFTVIASTVTLAAATHTGAVIPTVTAVTNAVVLPTIPTDWITAAGVAASAIGSAEAPFLDAAISSRVGKIHYFTTGASGVTTATGTTTTTLKTALTGRGTDIFAGGLVLFETGPCGYTSGGASNVSVTAYNTTTGDFTITGLTGCTPTAGGGDVFHVLAQKGPTAADIADIRADIPAALVSGRMDSSVGAMAADVVTATAIATDAIGATEIATDAIGASELAANAIGAAEVADGAIDAATLAAGTITTAAIADGAITSIKFADGTVFLKRIVVTAGSNTAKIVSTSGFTEATAEAYDGAVIACSTHNYVQPRGIIRFDPALDTVFVAVDQATPVGNPFSAAPATNDICLVFGKSR